MRVGDKERSQVGPGSANDEGLLNENHQSDPNDSKPHIQQQFRHASSGTRVVYGRSLW